VIVAAAVLSALGLAAGTAQAANTKRVWLCKPNHMPDPCTGAKGALNTTIINGQLEETLQKVKAATPQKVDCFYVYPTVSEQATVNANLTIEPTEEAVAEEQASRFSQDCKVYAPMYEQLTLGAINTPGAITFEASVRSYLGVKGAFDEYMAKYNKGRPFVLIGHSQGSAELEQLMKEEIDNKPAVLSQMVSAVILGGNVIVPEGADVGGSFQHIPACETATELHCVIAFSTFYKTPPNPSNFGRATSSLLGGPVPPPGSEVLCVNPTLLSQDGGTGPLLPSFSTKPFPGAIGLFTGPTPVSKLGTPWVTLPDQYTAQCKNEEGAQWLQVTPVGGGDEREIVQELLGPEWGLHLFDVGLSVGNLVNTVAIEEKAFSFEN